MLAIAGLKTQGSEMVFDIGGCFVLAFRCRLTAFKIGTCHDIQVFFQVVGGDGFGERLGSGIFWACAAKAVHRAAARKIFLMDQI